MMQGLGRDIWPLMVVPNAKWIEPGCEIQRRVLQQAPALKAPTQTARELSFSALTWELKTLIKLIWAYRNTVVLFLGF